MKRCQIRATGLLRSANRKPCPGDVSHAQLRREVDAAFRGWLDRHPELDRGFGLQWTSNRKQAADPEQLARAYLAMDRPRRGTLRAMARFSGLNYATVSGWCLRLRKERAAAA